MQDSSTAKPDHDWLTKMEEFSDLEQYFELFEVNFEPQVLLGRRVAILALFNRELASDGLSDFCHYQAALSRAYCKAIRGETWLNPVSLCGSCKDCSE